MATTPDLARDRASAPTTEELTSAVAAAVRAPSVHNTQPWRFVLGPGCVEVHADRSRQLAVLDPTGHDLVMSCGAAVAGARLFLAAAGWETRTVAPAEGARRDHLVTIETTGMRAPTADDVAMARAAEQRRCVRTRLTGRRVSPLQVEALLGEAVGVGVRAVALRDPVVRDAALVLQARADAVLESDPAYREELHRWVHRRGSAADGVEAGAHRAGRSPADWAQRAFPAEESTAPGLDAPPSPEADDPLVVVLAAPEDETSWLRAGEALGRLLVRATALGLVGVPMTQVAEVAMERERLRRVLRLTAYPQVLVRLGHELRPSLGRPTPRRPLAEVLERDLPRG